MDTFMALGAEFNAQGDTLHADVFPVDWSAFGKPVWIVIRAHRLPGIDEPEGRSNAADALAQIARDILANAGDAQGVQIDYDCATANLPHYADLMDALRGRLPDTPLSITALPTWLPQRSFKDLVADLDHFVLQAHSLERPDHIDDPVTLCNTAKVSGWVARADELGVPFYVALPTYGYRLLFDERGAFAGIRAEQDEQNLLGHTVKEVYADPAAIAGIVRTTMAKPPRHCRGFVWFRLPVEGDRLNWTWPTLARVMDGRAPDSEIHIEVRSPQPDLHEVWVANRGGYRPAEPLRIAVEWTYSEMVAHDALGGFRCNAESHVDSARITGPAPAPGDERMAAWYRFAPMGNDEATMTAQIETESP
jgi:hypothetical protein